MYRLPLLLMCLIKRSSGGKHLNSGMGSGVIMESILLYGFALAICCKPSEGGYDLDRKQDKEDNRENETE
ncbi:hypothetical protein L6452_12052 [Arctium lappa]|uniref:Uncharacterized protein n=1 Tax=Arctium lappa TaxID=4217 RepID=A0ACB9DQC3_ARCLA|nr:hypothetical protein L6452_12052 [Arctium lappa]